MALLPPTVIGPISVYNSSIRVRGQNIGAQVKLFTSGNPAPIGGGVATSSDQVFPLDQGVALSAGASITATQTEGGDSSPPSPSSVQVQAAPAAVESVVCQSHVYACGQSLAFFGAIPGATIEVAVRGATRGRAVSADGTAQVDLSAPTQPTDKLVVTQTANGIAGTPTQLAEPDTPPTNHAGQLAAPTLIGPVYACQTALEIGGVVDGALVTLAEAGAASTSLLFPLPSGLFVTDPLSAGDSISVAQTLEGCFLKGPSSAPVPVAAGSPPAPALAGPLYAGAVYARLDNLIPGAQVEIFQSGVSLGTATSSASTQFFSAPALSQGKMVKATQALCGNVSAYSNQVNVRAAPPLGRPKVQRPLYQCGAIVRVDNLQPGAVVYVYSTSLGAPIGWAPVTNGEMDIQLAPLLTAGDKIFAQQQLGTQTSRNSVSVAVRPLPNQGPPAIVAPVGAGSSYVYVQNAIAGARLDVFVNNVFRGGAIAWGATALVELSPPLLSIGDQVTVRETTCAGSATSFAVAVTGCNCVQTSKTPYEGVFLYTFNCHTPAGTQEIRQVQAANDTDAKQMAELGCDQEYGA